MKLPHVGFQFCGLILLWHPDRPGARLSHEQSLECRYRPIVTKWVEYR